MMTPLYQADSRWKATVLGHGPSTIGRAGCLLTCLTICARELGWRPALLPTHTNEMLLKADAFIADGIVIDKAAPAIGLSTRPALAGPPHIMADELARILDASQLAILHVDHDADRGGDVEGDHFIVATALVGDRVQCLDPAVGKVAIAFPALESIGEVVWGKTDRRKYRVMSVRAMALRPE